MWKEHSRVDTYLIGVIWISIATGCVVFAFLKLGNVELPDPLNAKTYVTFLWGFGCTAFTVRAIRSYLSSLHVDVPETYQGVSVRPRRMSPPQLRAIEGGRHKVDTKA
jgi:hypothetical protein